MLATLVGDFEGSSSEAIESLRAGDRHRGGDRRPCARRRGSSSARGDSPERGDLARRRGRASPLPRARSGARQPPDRGRGDVVARADAYHLGDPRGRAALPPGADVVRAHRRQLLPGAEPRQRVWRSSRSQDGRPERPRRGCGRRCRSHSRSAAGSCRDVPAPRRGARRPGPARRRPRDRRLRGAQPSGGGPPTRARRCFWRRRLVATAAGEPATAATSFAEALRLIEELGYRARPRRSSRWARTFASRVRRRHRRASRARASAGDLRPHRRDIRRDAIDASCRARRGAGSRRPLDVLNGYLVEKDSDLRRRGRIPDGRSLPAAGSRSNPLLTCSGTTADAVAIGHSFGTPRPRWTSAPA